MNRSAELQLGAARRAPNAPTWRSALQARGSWFQCMRKNERMLSMKVLLASSEVHPYSKTGGLADMAGALGKALAHAGLQVGLVTPLYQGILENFPDIQPMDGRVELPLG